MTEWGVVGVIIAMVGLIISVATPMIKLNSTLTKLITQMDNFSNGLAAFQVRYKEQLASQKEINETHQKELDNHEHRITVLEERQ